MKNIFFIHWAYGNGQENWFTWLKSELENKWYRVIVPVFPTPENQALNNWKKVFSEYTNYIDKDTIFVWHSLGCAFILDILENIDIKIHSSFLVAWFVSLLNHPIDEINKTFVDREFQWWIINKNCKKFVLINSDNDPYVPLQRWIELANRLNTEVTIIKNSWHFNKDAWYNKFEYLLGEINKI